jgi:hypothetical protein
MQELSAIVPARDKQTIIKTAISKVDTLFYYCAYELFLWYCLVKIISLMNH